MSVSLLAANAANAANVTDPDLGPFGDDPFWLILLKAVAVFAFLLLMTLFAIVFERKVVARMQQRLGPNRHGPKGWLQSMADGVKLMLKEDIIPVLADRPVFILAPIISAVPAFLAFAVIPFGPEVSIFGEKTTLQLADLPVSVLFVLAVASLGVYGLILSGWSSGSTYPLLGSLRSAAQIISYEVAMGLAFVAVFLYSGTLSTSGIVERQENWWYIALFPSFVIYCIAMVGETNRTPFDLPEAEGELVGGFHTEYSSIKFAFFFLAEYINMVTVSAVATTLFLGGWQPPPIPGLSGLDSGWIPVIWFVLKLMAFMFFFIWLRGTLPRLRYDQFMTFGWKVLIPAGLVWVLAIATLRTYQDNVTNRQPWIIGFGIVFVILLLIALIDPGAARHQRELEETERIRQEEAPSLDRIPWPPHSPTPPSPALVAAESGSATTVVTATPGARRSGQTGAEADTGDADTMNSEATTVPDVISAGTRPRQES
jgi:NADH-quinone oxidoreductase subunit H